VPEQLQQTGAFGRRELFCKGRDGSEHGVTAGRMHLPQLLGRVVSALLGNARAKQRVFANAPAVLQEIRWGYEWMVMVMLMCEKSTA
jgi:hypothetical protein